MQSAQGAPKLRGIIVDITERKLVEEELRQTNETLRALVGASPIGIVVLDPQGHVKMWNPALERIFGWKESEVLGRLLPIIPEDKLEQHHALRERVLRHEALSDVEVRLRKKDGSFTDISYSTAPPP